jgi:hypothetical protein
MHFMAAQSPVSGHAMQISGARQSMSNLHSAVAHIGLLNTHSRFSSQYDAAMTGTAAAAQSDPAHGVHWSPQDFPSQGDTSVQLSMPLVQTPFTQSDHGQTVLPFEHMVQGAALTGHCSAVMHICSGQVG